MTYTFVVDKVREVVYSCVTYNQLSNGKVYCTLLIDDWKRKTYTADSFRNRIVVNSEAKLLKDWLSMLCNTHIYTMEKNAKEVKEAKK